ncbi:C_GCAxxG_C_C family protein [bacterium]|nr:C_GCAxxG_C_C family protein [bacterium]
MSETRQEKALRFFRSGYNCSQSVFSVFSPDFGLEEKTAWAAASGFGSGMGALQKTCGAVTGGILVLGMRFFRQENTQEDKILVYSKVRRLVGRIEERFGSVECDSLLGADITNEAGLKAARERMLFKEKCEPVVLDVVKILENMI